MQTPVDFNQSLMLMCKIDDTINTDWCQVVFWVSCINDSSDKNLVHFQTCYILNIYLVFVYRKSLSLWQLSYDDSFIQMIYSLDNDLLDCEYLRGRNFAEEFVQKFYDEIERAEHLHKFSTFALTLPKHRHRIHRRLSKVDITMNSDDEIFDMEDISYQPLNTMNDVPDDLAVILSYENLKTQCDKNHRQMMQIIDDSQSKNQTKKINATKHLNR